MGKQIEAMLLALETLEHINSSYYWRDFVAEPIAALVEALKESNEGVNAEECEQVTPTVKPKLVATSQTAEVVTMLCCGIECPECGTTFTVQASQTKENV